MSTIRSHRAIKNIGRQRDAKTHESKTVVSGATLDGSSAQVVVKTGFTGKLIVITVYVL